MGRASSHAQTGSTTTRGTIFLRRLLRRSAGEGGIRHAPRPPAGQHKRASSRRASAARRWCSSPRRCTRPRGKHPPGHTHTRIKFASVRNDLAAWARCSSAAERNAPLGAAARRCRPQPPAGGGDARIAAANGQKKKKRERPAQRDRTVTGRGQHARCCPPFTCPSTAAGGAKALSKGGPVDLPSPSARVRAAIGRGRPPARARSLALAHAWARAAGHFQINAAQTKTTTKTLAAIGNERAPEESVTRGSDRPRFLRRIAEGAISCRRPARSRARRRTASAAGAAAAGSSGRPARARVRGPLSASSRYPPPQAAPARRPARGLRAPRLPPGAAAGPLARSLARAYRIS